MTNLPERLARSRRLVLRAAPGDLRVLARRYPQTL